MEIQLVDLPELGRHLPKRKLDFGDLHLFRLIDNGKAHGGDGCGTEEVKNV